jgi:GTP-binding protein
MTPLVAIIGRPNVGKSTLFNRIAGKRMALVEGMPGVTRDRLYADVEWEGHAFTVIDTGGLVESGIDRLLEQVNAQAQVAIEESEIVLFVLDARAGLNAADQEVAKKLRRSGKQVIAVVNKVDTEADVAMTSDFYRLGFAETMAVSAEHARNIGPLLDRLVSLLPPVESVSPIAAPEDPVRVAIVGRPNVGKSSLVNKLLGQERLVAGELPGTTRDPVDSQLTIGDEHFVLTDTAGVRRRKSLAQRVEQLSVLAALRAMDRSEVAALVIDAVEPGVDLDARIAGLAEEKGLALLLVVNKWDKLPKANEKDFRAELKYRLPFVPYAPVVFTSALTGSKVEKVLKLAAELRGQRRFRAPTPQLNRLLQQVTDAHPPPLAAGRPLRLYYVAQVGTEPPTFAFTSNHPGQIPDHYRRYLSNQVRRAFGLRVPIRLVFRERPGRAKRASRTRPRSR